MPPTSSAIRPSKRPAPWIAAIALLLFGAASVATTAARDNGANPTRPLASPGSSAPSSLFGALRSAAPSLNPNVLALALEARDCAAQRGVATSAQHLAVIDYTRPSTEPRLWVFDLTNPALLFAEHVAHGRGSGENFARSFSNLDGSHQSSLGLFETGETYQGGNGYSLRMDGLEPGINDRARERAIVMHGAWYVDPALAGKQGRLGRSYGCPAVRTAIAQPMIDSLKAGQLLFAYYPDAQWLSQSRLFGCRGSTTAGGAGGRTTGAR